MLWIICGIGLLLDQWSAGEDWYKGAIRSAAVAGALILLGYHYPGQMLMGAIVVLSAVAAAEMYRCSEKKPPIPLGSLGSCECREEPEPDRSPALKCSSGRSDRAA